MRRTTLTRLRLLAGFVAAAGLLGGSAQAQPAAPGAPSTAGPAEARIDSFTGAVIVPLGNLVKYDPKNNKAIKGIAIANELGEERLGHACVEGQVEVLAHRVGCRLDRAHGSKRAFHAAAVAPARDGSDDPDDAEEDRRQTDEER